MPLSVLVIGWVWPEPKASAAGSHMLSLLRQFRAQGWSVIFASSAEVTPLSYPLAELGIASQAVAVNDSQFDEFLKSLQPNIVLFDRFLMEEQYGWRVAQVCPQALRVIDTEDLQSLRYARHQAFKNGTSEQDYYSSDLAKREIAAIWRSDCSLIISRAEHELLTQHYQVPNHLLYYTPLQALYELGEAVESPSFDRRSGFVAIGNFRHAPNWDAVLYLKQLWPKVRARIKGAQLDIYGAYMPPKARQLHDPTSGFCVNGWIDQPQTAFNRARVSVAPLRFGAGQKGKLLLSMATATPSVTTSVGAESMVEGDWPGTIADDDSAFIDAMVELHENQTKWQTASARARECIAANCSDCEPSLIEYLEQLIANLDKHREQNFIGAMLNHHHHQSTKYMSQWIEAKNKITD